MRFYYLVIILLFKVADSIGQDLIVSTKNDSINCYIEFTTNKKIAFTILNEKKENVKAFISLNNINEYVYDYFKDTTFANGISDRYNTITPEIEQLFIVEKNNFSTSRIECAIYSGFATRFKNTNTSYNSLDNKLKNGIVYNADIMFYNKNNVGLGFTYSYFGNKANDEILNKNAEISIHQLCALLGQKYELNNAKTIVRWKLGIGVGIYNQTGNVTSLDETLLCITDGLFIDQKLINKLFFTAGISHKTGTKYLDSNKSIGIGSIQFLVGLRIGL